LTQKMSGKMLATHSSKPNSNSKPKQPKMWLLGFFKILKINSSYIDLDYCFVMLVYAIIL
ncbi:hypothetical protein QEP27_32620, partial [Pseudomonas nunensis]|nr:hypothetical protein [Pseudomonas nunensis]